MQLQSIDKAIYRKRLNRVIALVVILLATVTLASSTLLIHLFGEPGGSNFGYNLTGLVIGCAIILLLFQRYKNHPYLHEVLYVWRLKQELNRIYRSIRKVTAAAETDNPDALIILNFSYQGSKQMYELDDNDLTMDQLKQDIRNLDDKITALGLTIATDDYEPGLIKKLT